MVFVNFIMGIVAAVLVVTGLKKDDVVLDDKSNKVEILENHKIVEPKFDFGILQDRAKKLLETAYQPPKKSINKSLSEIDYNKYKNLHFLPEKSLWRKEGHPFQIQFLHPGYIYDYNVRINQLVGDKFVNIPYNSEWFDFRELGLKERVPVDAGYSGFKIHYPINTEEHTDEFAVFQGASYFRAVSQKQYYGLSARGLATNTAMPYPEDFPIFKEFWIQKPKQNDQSIFVYALLDGKSVVGAYRFEFIPGKITVTKVKAVITLRKDVDRLGLAPLTSMFWYGENSEIVRNPAIPEVHDSDGLLIHGNDDEWIWRPIDNPKQSSLNSFQMEKIKGFGLMQRDREFASYEDHEMKYHLRPSAWVTPDGDWGKGSVQLFRNPTIQDSDDNVVAFWAPEKNPKVGEPFEFSYEISWVNDKPENKILSETIATRLKSFPKDPQTKQFQLDFKGDKIKSIDSFEKLETIVQGPEHAEISEILFQKIEESEKWRLSFKVKNKTPGKPIELRAYLKQEEEMITEIWTYTLEI